MVKVFLVVSLLNIPAVKMVMCLKLHICFIVHILFLKAHQFQEAYIYLYNCVYIQPSVIKELVFWLTLSLKLFYILSHEKTCKCRIIIGLNTVIRFSQNHESGSIFMIVSKQGNPYSGIFSLAKEISNLSAMTI